MTISGAPYLNGLPVIQQWTAVRRRHTVAVTADAPNALPEKDETNNALTRLFAVRGRAR